MKNISKFILVILLITGLILFINYRLEAKIEFKDLLTIIFFTMAYACANYLGITLVISIIKTIFRKEGQEKLGLITGLISSVLVSFLATFLVNLLIISVEGKTIEETWNGIRFVFYYLIPILISVIITLINYISWFYEKIYHDKNQKQELVIQKISSQYEGLQKQLSSHFLFNSLNVLDSLIDENRYAAHEFTQELSSIYRYVLEQQTNDFVTVNEELKFVKSYINLMNKRFEGMVEFSVSDDINKEGQVFPLSIQLLIENAFKHNRLSESNPLKIEIIQIGDVLSVKNNLSPKKNLQSTSKKGLVNIQARYQKLGLSMEIEKTEKEFKVYLPIINKNYVTMEYTVKQREVAEKRVVELKKFYKTLMSNIMAILICTSINLITAWGHIFTANGINLYFFWAIWVIVPCVIVVLGKAITLFCLPDSKYDWEERKIKEILEKKRFNS